jgi:short-subunit dehydrogenase
MNGVNESFNRRYGPWALVTGASSGIGEHFCRELAGRGLDLVVITARRASLLRGLAEDLRAAHGIRVEVAAIDLAQPGGVDALLVACEERDIGLVVSNAGFGLKGYHHDQRSQDLDAMVALNCRAPMLLAHAFVPRLIRRSRGGLLFTASIEGFVSFPFSAAYAATKAFVVSLGEALSVELANNDVDVLVLAPGSTDTNAPISQGIDRSQLIGLMQPSEVAARALAQLGRRPVFVPGWANRALIGLLRALPRRAAVRLAGAGMRRAIEHSQPTPS